MVEPHGQRGNFFSEVTSSFQHSLENKCNNLMFFNVALLNPMVSQLLVELQRTLKGQHGLEFDIQSIWKKISSHRCKNGGLLGPFLQHFGLTNKIFSFFKVKFTCCCTVPPLPSFFCCFKPVFKSLQMHGNFHCHKYFFKTKAFKGLYIFGTLQIKRDLNCIIC